LDTEKVILEQASKIGGLEEATQTIKVDVHTIFQSLETIKDIANKSNLSIEKLSLKIDNGISSKLKIITDTLETIQNKNERNGERSRDKQDRKEEKQQDKFERADERKEERIHNLEEDSWIVKILSGGTKKALIGLVSLMIISGIIFAVITNAGYYMQKKYTFQETPGLIKELVEQGKSEYHIHRISNSEIILHAGNLDLPAWRINPETQQKENMPSVRTEEGFNKYIKERVVK
jgi:hypothetical protein